MKNFEYFNNNALKQYLILREGETKFGEKIKFPPETVTDVSEFLNNTEAHFVIYGIKEFAGIKANYGRVGTMHSWEVFLKSFLNIQNNKFLKGSNIAIIGCLDYVCYENELNTLDISIVADRERLYEIVSDIDKDVTYLNTLIHRAGKTPIVIGGGHNNAYGNIKGLALAKGKSVNVVNFDAHADFRALEGRHSGNGFSYAFNEGFMDIYCAFGIHENYLNKFMLQQFKEQWEQLKMFTFDEMKVRFEKDFMTSINAVLKLMKTNCYGIEIDVDAIENIASSAMSPSGFSVTEARQFVNFMASSNNASYLHLCEGSSSLSTFPESMLGKLLTYLTVDFMKAQLNILK